MSHVCVLEKERWGVRKRKREKDGVGGCRVRLSLSSEADIQDGESKIFSVSNSTEENRLVVEVLCHMRTKCLVGCDVRRTTGTKGRVPLKLVPHTLPVYLSSGCSWKKFFVLSDYGWMTVKSKVYGVSWNLHPYKSVYM